MGSAVCTCRLLLVSLPPPLAQRGHSMNAISRREVLASAALAGAGFIVPRSDASDDRLTDIRVPDSRVVIAARSPAFREVRFLRDLVGDKLTCLKPGNDASVAERDAFDEQRERYFCEVAAGTQYLGRAPMARLQNAQLRIVRGIERVPAQIQALLDGTCIEGISEALGTGHFTYLLRYLASAGIGPFKVLLTEHVARELQASAIFRQMLIVRLHPGLAATVVRDDTAIAAMLREDEFGDLGGPLLEPNPPYRFTFSPPTITLQRG